MLSYELRLVHISEGVVEFHAGLDSVICTYGL